MVVIDTSVAYKWFSTENEEHLKSAIGLLEEHLTKKEIITVPDLIIYELANAWATKTKLTISQIRTFIKDLEELEIKIEPIDLKLISKAVEFSKQYNVSVYDSTYIAFAEDKKCNFYTADSKFIKQVNLPFIKHIKDYRS